MRPTMMVVVVALLILIAAFTTIPAFIACWPNSLVLGEGLFWAYATGMCD